MQMHSPRAVMDLELKDRRAVNHVLASFARVWPYIAIVALLGLHAVNYSKTPVRRTAAPVIRNTLYVGSPPLPGTGPDANVRMYLVYLKYWTVNLLPQMVYPEVLFHPNFSIKGDRHLNALQQGRGPSEVHTLYNRLQTAHRRCRFHQTADQGWRPLSASFQVM